MNPNGCQCVLLEYRWKVTRDAIQRAILNAPGARGVFYGVLIGRAFRQRVAPSVFGTGSASQAFAPPLLFLIQVVDEFHQRFGTGSCTISSY